MVKENEDKEREQERKMRRAKMDRIYARSIMNDDLKWATLNNFIERPGTEGMRIAGLDFVKNFDGRKTGLMFHGKPGNGKSHMAAAINHELNHQGWICLFLDVPQLFNLAKDSNRQGSKISLTDIINGAIAADLLTLDELGSGYLTEYEFNDILFPIINGRQGKPTNYTLNLDLKRLQKWFEIGAKGIPLDVDGRLYDRILGGTDIYENSATSKRREDAMKRMNGGMK